jgi:hypothetical protein
MNFFTEMVEASGAVWGGIATDGVGFTVEADKLIALSGKSRYNPMLYRIWHRES